MTETPTIPCKPVDVNERDENLIKISKEEMEEAFKDMEKLKLIMDVLSEERFAEAVKNGENLNMLYNEAINNIIMQRRTFLIEKLGEKRFKEAVANREDLNKLYYETVEKYTKKRKL